MHGYEKLSLELLLFYFLTQRSIRLELILNVLPNRLKRSDFFPQATSFAFLIVLFSFDLVLIVVIEKFAWKPGLTSSSSESYSL